jgi:hypothetical protein
MIVGIELRLGKKIIKLEEEGNSEILVAVTDSGNQVWRLAMGRLFGGGRRRGTAAAAAASPSRSNHNKHWPVKSPTHLRCRILLAAKERAHSAPDVTWACV